MENIMVLYGGKSVEHDISILTAIQTMKNMNIHKYNIIPVYIRSNGDFIVVKDYLKVENYAKKLDGKKVQFFINSPKIKIGKLSIIKIDCAIVCLHGLNGEDGTISGLLRLCNIHQTSPDVLGSAICMDKIIMKDIFVANSIPCVDYTYTTRKDFLKNRDEEIEKIKSKLKFPMIVKPSNLGSSIGITKARTTKELIESINTALCFDKRIIIEQCLTDFKEINLSCLGNEDCKLSSLEQPTNWKDFLSFSDKYIKQSKIPQKK